MLKISTGPKNERFQKEDKLEIRRVLHTGACRMMNAWHVAIRIRNTADEVAPGLVLFLSRLPDVSRQGNLNKEERQENGSIIVLYLRNVALQYS